MMLAGKQQRFDGHCLSGGKNVIDILPAKCYPTVMQISL